MACSRVCIGGVGQRPNVEVCAAVKVAAMVVNLGLVMLPISALANEEEQENTTTTTTTTIPGEVEEVETFDGPEETTTTTIPEETETTTTTTTTIPEWEQSTDIELPEDELDSQGNEVENNIQIDDKHSNGNWSCCGMTDFHMNLHYFQHGNDSNDYTLPETTTVDEEELDMIYTKLMRLVH